MIVSKSSTASPRPTIGVGWQPHACDPARAPGEDHRSGRPGVAAAWCTGVIRLRLQGRGTGEAGRRGRTMPREVAEGGTATPATVRRCHVAAHSDVPPGRACAGVRNGHRERPLGSSSVTVEMGLLAGVAVDAVAGDPRRGHPVAAFGRAAAALERRLYADSAARGAAFTAICVLGAAGLGFAVDHLAAGGRAAPPARPRGAARRSRAASPAWSRRARVLPAGAVPRVRRMRVRAGTNARARGARLLVTAVATWAVVGGTSLGREGRAMAAALDAGDLGAARRRLPHLCGRDPSGLDAAELARATVESIAENTSDAVVAPLLWGAALGVPGLLAYRAVNTLDAMVGHRSPRYARFGWAAARLDDAGNWLPARVTGLLAAACAPLAGGSPRAAYAVLRRDGAAHPSPNAGRCEAAFAGALGVRLGGVNVYGDRVEHRPELGDGRAPDTADIRRSVRLSRAVTIAAAAVAVGCRIGARVAARGPTPGHRATTAR